MATPTTTISDPDANALLLKAVIADDLDGVRAAIDAHADVHTQNEVALRMAARNGHFGLVKCLLAAGADPVAAWVGSSGHDQPIVTLTLDACTPWIPQEQRSKLASLSPGFCWPRSRPDLVGALIHHNIDDVRWMLQNGEGFAEAWNDLSENEAEQTVAFLCNNANELTPQQRATFAAVDDRLVQLDAFNSMS